MKIVLLAVNSKYVHSSLAVWYLAGGIKKYAQNRHNAVVIESTINKKTAETVEMIVSHKPDIVGISSYIWNTKMLPILIDEIKKQLSEVIILLGGPEASHNAGFWLSKGVRYVLCGEGEHHISLLLDALESKDDEALKHIPGLCFLTDGNTVTNPQSEPSDIYINPYSEEYFNSLDGAIAYIESSRGCPFNCSYCLSAGDKVRFFPLEETKENIDRLILSGTKTVKFVDRTFNCNLERAKEIIRYIIELDTGCCFHFELVADLFDEELLMLLKYAPPGRIRLEIGIQSFNEDTLEAVSRKTDIALVIKNIKHLIENQNIHIHIDLIAGLPYETYQLFKTGFNIAYNLGAHTLQLGFLKFLYGSEMRNLADRYEINYSNEPPYEILDSKWISAEEINSIECAENALQNTYNKGRFRATLHYVLMNSSFEPFDLFRKLGENVPHHMISLQNYAADIYMFLSSLSGVDEKRLRDCMVYDILGMTRGKAMPNLLRITGNERRKLITEVEALLKHKVDDDTVELLSSGRGAYVEDSSRDQVTGLYAVKLI